MFESRCAHESTRLNVSHVDSHVAAKLYWAGLAVSESSGDVAETVNDLSYTHRPFPASFRLHMSLRADELRDALNNQEVSR